MAPKGPKKQALAAINTIAKKRGGQASSLESELNATGSEKSIEKKPLKTFNPKAIVNEKGDASENDVDLEFDRTKSISNDTFVKVEKEQDSKKNISQATKTGKNKGKKVKETELTPKSVKHPKPRGKRVIIEEQVHTENTDSLDENESPDKTIDKLISCKKTKKAIIDTKENIKSKPKSKKIVKSISEQEESENVLETVQNINISKKSQGNELYDDIKPSSSKTKQKLKAKPEAKAKAETKTNLKGKKNLKSLNNVLKTSVVDAIKEEHLDEEEDKLDKIENKPMTPKVQAKSKGKKQVVRKPDSKKHNDNELNDDKSRVKTEPDDITDPKNEKNIKNTPKLLKKNVASTSDKQVEESKKLLKKTVNRSKKGAKSQERNISDEQSEEDTSAKTSKSMIKSPSECLNKHVEISKKLSKKPVSRSKKGAKSQERNLADDQSDEDISAKTSKSMMKSTSEFLDDDPPTVEDAENAKPKIKRKLMNIEKSTSMLKKNEVKGKRKQVENTAEDREEGIEPNAKKLKNTKVKAENAQHEDPKDGPTKTKKQPKKEKVTPAEQGEGDAVGPSMNKKKKTEKEKETKEKPALKNKASTDYEDIDFSNTTKDSKGNQWNFKIASWNVDGVRAWLTKCGLDYMKYEKPDILCLQEVKCSDDKLPPQVKEVPGYHAYWLCSEKDGYAGVGIYSKDLAIHVDYGLGDSDLDTEGRIITAEFENFYLICTYVPNAGRKLVTLPRRLTWNEAFRKHVKELDAKKPVIICGDMNVAHKEIDLANPKTNKRNAGFTEEERAGMTDLLGDGLVDTFRNFYPNTTGAYTFWTYMLGSRAKNVGWRLDYFLVSERLMSAVCDSLIRNEVFGSDHCPIALFMHLNSADQPQATHE